jgi:hypothetical protein
MGIWSANLSLSDKVNFPKQDPLGFRFSLGLATRLFQAPAYRLEQGPWSGQS